MGNALQKIVKPYFFFIEQVTPEFIYYTSHINHLLRHTAVNNEILAGNKRIFVA